jgi:DNA-binding HxlR family transcriptional regulator
MGIEVPAALGRGDRSLLGHRLLLILRTGPKSMRELHAATGRRVPARELREALDELLESGLLRVTVGRTGQRGGRPRETWTLLYPGSSAVLVAEQALAAASARRRRSRGLHTPPNADLLQGGLRRPVGALRRRRRLKPVPADVAEEVCDWVSRGLYLRDYCRRPGSPATRTVYHWTKKSPEFRRHFYIARDFGEDAIRARLLELADSPRGRAACISRATLREFKKAVMWPLFQRLTRWRRHPSRQVGRVSWSS